MVKVLIGDLLKSSAQTLVNTVNTVGVMGKGIALKFKQAYPDMYEDYLNRVKVGKVRLGQPYLYKRLVRPWIILFPTKQHWRSTASLKAIVLGLEYLLDHYREWGITSLAVPPLGCGEGQLEWSVVGPTLYRYLSMLPIPVELYAPYGTPEEELEARFLTRDVQAADLAGTPRRIGPAWVALVEILNRIESRPYHWPVGKISFQKVAYFATQSGIPTGLDYQRGSYGPFARDLKKSVARLINNGLIEEETRDHMIRVKVGPTYRDARKVEAYQSALKEWDNMIERVSDLFARMTTKQAELAATVHFATTSLARDRKDKVTERDVLRAVMNWKQRRRPPLKEQEVAETIRGLAMLGWLDVAPSSDLPVREEIIAGA